MAPTASTIRFVPKQNSHHRHGDLKPATFVLTGNIKDPRFQQTRVIAMAVAQKHPDLIKVEVNGVNPLDYSLHLTQIKHKYVNMIDSLHAGCSVEIDGRKVLSPPDFAAMVADKYDVRDSRPAGLYAALGKTAFQDYINDIKDRVVFLDISIDDKPAGRLTLHLFSKVCPHLVAHFMSFVVGGRQGPHDTEITYKGCSFSRLLPGGWIQTGDIVLPQGTVFKEEVMPDENFIVKHDRRGIVSMVNSGPNTNYSAFMVTLKPMPYFDRKYVAIGQVIDGDETLAMMEAVPTRFERPQVDIVITNVGEIVRPNSH
ncbi:cyclophilin-like domain-containing protein [Entophlyctis helioformis]|nr:cyclophilin-like domain-containing protein [Entophlyctis helioformis]